MTPDQLLKLRSLVRQHNNRGGNRKGPHHRPMSLAEHEATFGMTGLAASRWVSQQRGVSVSEHWVHRQRRAWNVLA